MFIEATYDGEKCLLNTDYIVDIFDADSFSPKVFVLDVDRLPYRIKQEDLKKVLEEVNG